MKSNRNRIVLSMVLLAGVVWLPQTVGAQYGGRFRGLDRNRDGVITRAEWRGSDQSFRQQDSNRDGILSGDEVRDDQDTGIVPDFSAVDLDGNGHVTAMEWRRAFNQLDVNRDGSLTADELGTPRSGQRWSGNNQTAAPTRAFQAGVERGVIDGRQAGREDAARRVWDLDGQRELEQADAGYTSELGPREQYQAGYRDGFRRAYAEGYGPRR